MKKHTFGLWVIVKLDAVEDAVYLAETHGYGTSWTVDKMQARVFKTKTEANDKIKWDQLYRAVGVVRP